MKKILSCLGVALFTFSFAYSQEAKKNSYAGTEQQAIQTSSENVATESLSHRTAPSSSSVNAGGDTIYSETFGGGMPAGWTQKGPNQIWKWCAGTYNVGGSGCFSTGSVLTNSTTQANGSIIFDADSANKAATDPACSSGGGSYVVLADTLISSSYNFTGYPGVHIKYQQRFRLCCAANATVSLGVSNNNGATWTIYDSRRTVAINQYALTNPDHVDFNISSVAANQPNVKIAFIYSLGNTYYWNVDDIAFTQSFADDMVLQTAFTDFNYIGGGYYTQTPIRHVVPIAFSGATLNDGSNAETNVKLNVNINAGLYDQTSPVLASVAAAHQDTLSIATPFTPAAKGVYNATFTVQQTQTDQLPVSNTILKVFEVNDTVYGRDDGLPTGSIVTAGGYIGGNANDAGLANLYETYSQDTAVSVSFYLEIPSTAGSGIGAAMVAAIYKWSYPYSVAAIPTVPQIESDIYDEASAADAGKWVTLPLLTSTGSPVLLKDSNYIVCIRSLNEGDPGTPNHRVRLSSDLVTQQQFVTSFVKTPTGANPWGWINVQPRIRLNTKKPLGVGIPEISANGIRLEQNMPNPFNDRTLINYEVNKFSNVSLEVYDIIGNLVWSQNEGSVAAGKHSIELNTHLAAGAYSYTLRANETSLTKQMIVTQ